MKRFKASGSNGFARFGIRPHHVRAGSTFRGGRRL